MKTRRDESFEVEDQPPLKKARLTAQIVDKVDQEFDSDIFLPFEIWLAILEHLHDKADLVRINQVCTAFKNLIAANFNLWYQLPAPEKDFAAPIRMVDGAYTFKKTYELGNGDVVVILPNGQFQLLPVTKNEWLLFEGHADPNNFHIAKPFQFIIDLYHNRLATCAEDGIRIWDRLTTQLIRHLSPQHPQDRPFRLLRMLHNDLISASPDGSIYIYSENEAIPVKIECPAGIELGELKHIRFWHGDIVAEFNQAVVRWNRYGRSPTICLKTADLHAQLLELANSILANQDGKYSEFINGTVRARFESLANKEFKFDWQYMGPDSRVEVILNKTLSFIVSLSGTPSPVFLGVAHTQVFGAANDNRYFLIKSLFNGSYEALFDWQPLTQNFKNKLKKQIGNAHIFGMFNACNAFFLMRNNTLIVWEILLDQVHDPVSLEKPANLDQDAEFFYQYTNGDWEFKVLSHERLLGIHKIGRTLIWDIRTGKIQHHIQLGYSCDPDKKQNAMELTGGDILIQRFAPAMHFGSPKPPDHVCIYRFMSRPPVAQVEDAMDLDSDIINPSLKR